jgi:type IV secretory pathway VirB10-like protein
MQVDEMNRLLAQAYSSLALQAAGIAVPGMLGLGFHVQPQETPQHLSAPSPANVVVGHIQQQPAAVSPPPPVDTHATVLQEQQQQQQQNLAPLSSLLTPESDAAELPTAPGSDPAAEAADARERCRRAHELATTPAATAETDVAQGGQ